MGLGRRRDTSEPFPETRGRTAHGPGKNYSFIGGSSEQTWTRWLSKYAQNVFPAPNPKRLNGPSVDLRRICMALISCRLFIHATVSRGDALISPVAASSSSVGEAEVWHTINLFPSLSYITHTTPPFLQTVSLR